MINLEILKKQHDTIKAEISFIENEIKKGKEEINEVETALHISKLAGHLKIHLLEEDKILYPNLLSNSDIQIKELTNQYMNEMGELANNYTIFKNNYNVGTRLRRNIDTFIVDAKIIIDLLKKRMKKEDQELYQLIMDKKL